MTDWEFRRLLESRNQRIQQLNEMRKPEDNNFSSPSSFSGSSRRVSSEELRAMMQQTGALRKPN